MNDDERLKQSFETLREDDARRMPSFDAVRKRRPQRRSPWAVVVPLASAAAAAAVFVLWCNVSHDEAPAPTAVAAAPAAAAAAAGAAVADVPAHEVAVTGVDDAPLDFLLDVPGFRGAPNFDTSFLKGSLR